jgi:hypothetical protein
VVAVGIAAILPQHPGLQSVGGHAARRPRTGDYLRAVEDMHDWVAERRGRRTGRQVAAPVTARRGAASIDDQDRVTRIVIDPVPLLQWSDGGFS